MKLHSSYLLPSSAAILLATSFWLRTCTCDSLYMPLIPDILAISSNSSTSGGSMTYAGLPRAVENSPMICEPSTAGWSAILPDIASTSIFWFTGKMPPGVDSSPPEYAAKASMSLSWNPWLWRTAITTPTLNGRCELTVGNSFSISGSWLMFSLKRHLLSSKTAHLVEVEPGLIVKIL